MRHISPALLAAFILAGCAPALQTASLSQPTAAPVAAMRGQVTWRENTPLGARFSDGLSCELVGLSLPPFASEAEIQTARQFVPPAERDARRDSCMIQRGYSITQEKVCTPAELQGQAIQISRTIDFLPPLSAVRCFVPSQGGFVLA